MGLNRLFLNSQESGVDFIVGYLVVPSLHKIILGNLEGTCHVANLNM